MFSYMFSEKIRDLSDFENISVILAPTYSHVGDEEDSLRVIFDHDEALSHSPLGISPRHFQRVTRG